MELFDYIETFYLTRDVYAFSNVSE